ncbi:hypothetical protein LCGC14_2008620 [marine sediment metagenome]|uniref:Uncharacterized protein n=1 Tax=marine sediment metagenome TaxID=412755 RepID=A0A0F9F0Y7_9ZZZZ
MEVPRSRIEIDDTGKEYISLPSSMGPIFEVRIYKKKNGKWQRDPETFAFLLGIGMPAISAVWLIGGIRLQNLTLSLIGMLISYVFMWSLYYIKTTIKIV